MALHDPKRFGLDIASIVDIACDLLDKGYGYTTTGGLNTHGNECDPLSEEAVAWDGVGALYRASYTMKDIFPNIGRLRRTMLLTDEGTWQSFGRSKFRATFNYMMSQGQAPTVIQAMRTWAEEVFNAHNSEEMP